MRYGLSPARTKLVPLLAAAVTTLLVMACQEPQINEVLSNKTMDAVRQDQEYVVVTTSIGSNASAEKINALHSMGYELSHTAAGENRLVMMVFRRTGPSATAPTVH